MKKIIIWGAGTAGAALLREVKDAYDIIAFVDSDKDMWGGEKNGIPILPPEQTLHEMEYDYVLIGTMAACEEVFEQLKEMGIPEYKIKKDHYILPIQGRITFLKCYAEMVEMENINGAVAEGGVYKGEFARYINEFFPARSCYLFDTFEGFEQSDIDVEKDNIYGKAGHLDATSEQFVLSKMPNKETVKICKGYFPESAISADIKEKFCFVSLDMNLYKPTYEGIKYFYPKMSERGVILMHDYFSQEWINVKKAVADYEKNFGITLIKMPIGDGMSLAIVKN